MPKPIRVPKTPKSGAGLERNQVPLSAEITCRFRPKSSAGLLRFLHNPQRRSGSPPDHTGVPSVLTIIFQLCSTASMTAGGIGT
jgi:hypothetical protein